MPRRISETVLDGLVRIGFVGVAKPQRSVLTRRNGVDFGGRRSQGFLLRTAKLAVNSAACQSAWPTGQKTALRRQRYWRSTAPMEVARAQASRAHATCEVLLLGQFEFLAAKFNTKAGFAFT